MKKTLCLILALVLMVCLAACGRGGAGASSSSAASSQAVPSPTPARGESAAPSGSAARPGSEAQPEAGSGAKALVVYFSWSGNTESVANEIAAQTGADLFEIEPQEPYTDDYDTLLDIAQAEQRDAARPAIAGAVENFEQYEVLYLGYPNWWGDLPMILYTFLETYDCTGKTIAPFVTSGGSGFSRTLDTIRSMQPGAEVTDGLSLGSADAAAPGEAVAQWLATLGLDG